jgi:hypothetical protein
MMGAIKKERSQKPGARMEEEPTALFWLLAPSASGFFVNY